MFFIRSGSEKREKSQGNLFFPMREEGWERKAPKSNVSWEIQGDALVFAGEAAMENCIWDINRQQAIQPWAPYRNMIKKS